MFEKIKKILRKKRDFIEFEPEREKGEKVMVRMEKLSGIVDADRIARLVLEGNIVFLNTKDLRRRDFSQFQNSLEKLKRYSNQYNWGIAATEDGYVLLTPRFVKIVKE